MLKRLKQERSTLLQKFFSTISRMLVKPTDTSAIVGDLASIWQPKCPTPPKRIPFACVVCWIWWDIHTETPRFGVNIRFVPDAWSCSRRNRMIKAGNMKASNNQIFTGNLNLQPTSTSSPFCFTPSETVEYFFLTMTFSSTPSGVEKPELSDPAPSP